jgi:hypothetical protein
VLAIVTYEGEPVVTVLPRLAIARAYDEPGAVPPLPPRAARLHILTSYEATDAAREAVPLPLLHIARMYDDASAASAQPIPFLRIVTQWDENPAVTVLEEVRVTPARPGRGRRGSGRARSPRQ